MKITLGKEGRGSSVGCEAVGDGEAGEGHSPILVSSHSYALALWCRRTHRFSFTCH
jgi:hypothetical protein